MCMKHCREEHEAGCYGTLNKPLRRKKKRSPRGAVAKKKRVISTRGERAACSSYIDAGWGRFWKTTPCRVRPSVLARAASARPRCWGGHQTLFQSRSGKTFVLSESCSKKLQAKLLSARKGEISEDLATYLGKTESVVTRLSAKNTTSIHQGSYRNAS